MGSNPHLQRRPAQSCHCACDSGAAALHCCCLLQPGWRDEQAAATLAASLGPAVAGKVVVDATNPLTGFPGLEVLWNGTSGAHTSVLPQARVEHTQLSWLCVVWLWAGEESVMSGCYHRWAVNSTHLMHWVDARGGQNAPWRLLTEPDLNRLQYIAHSCSSKSHFCTAASKRSEVHAACRCCSEAQGVSPCTVYVRA